MSSSKKDIGSSTTTVNKRSNSRSDTSLDDLPELVFAEILCRLDSNKLLVRCKGISKRWLSLISSLIRDSCFIARFISLKQDRKVPIIRTLLNRKGNEFRPAKRKDLHTALKMKLEEFSTTMKSWKTIRVAGDDDDDEDLMTTSEFRTILATTIEQPLIRVFRLLDGEPVVVATYNDLVLCRKHHTYYEKKPLDCDLALSRRYDRLFGEGPVDSDDDYEAVEYWEFFICNPHTLQFVQLPDTPFDYEGSYMVVGFICDLHNSGSRCRFVKFTPNDGSSDKLGVEIYTSENGSWEKSTVSFPQKVTHSFNDISYPYNGMLYWGNEDNIFIGFDPFMINSRSKSGYKGRIIEFEFGDESSMIKCVGTCGGRLRFIGNVDLVSCSLHVWELEEEQDERALDRSGKLFLKRTTYPLDGEMFHDSYVRDYYIEDLCEVFDPNDENILYMYSRYAWMFGGKFFRCNIRTTRWSEIRSRYDFLSSCYSARFYDFQLTELPWWPTPVPE